MQIIDVTRDNLDREHICCAISEKKDETCVADKKAWLRDRFDEGLVFKKLDVRGKVFVEYLPAEMAWVPVDAPGYLYITCLWVSGQYKGQGHASALLAACEADARAKGKAGLVVLSSDKKRVFVQDKKFYLKKGFRVADQAAPYYELLYLPFADDAKPPRFYDHARNGTIDEGGIVLYYTDQCPFTNTYAKRIAAIAKAQGREMTVYRITDREAARSAPGPYTTYSLYYNGQFVTNEILSEKRFEAFLDEHP